MELSFEYFDWLKWLNEKSPLLIFISLFGSFIFLIAMGLIRGSLKRIGLSFIADWEILDYIMICVFLTGFIGGFLLIILSAVVLQTETDGMTGIRFIMILVALFICISAFYLTNKVTLKKWIDDVTPSTKENPGKRSGRRKK